MKFIKQLIMLFVLSSLTLSQYIFANFINNPILYTTNNISSTKSISSNLQAKNLNIITNEDITITGADINA
ncbi:hypothetical protein, partial [Campylobacter majalis]|uniref:hypothetical protein n=1 Tax=Campylobacter majalis TaxID=2790656 RepID=UPI001E4A8995